MPVKEDFINHPFLYLVLPIVVISLIPLFISVYKQNKQYGEEFNKHPNITRGDNSIY